MTIGLAIYIDEYVPTTTPIIMASAKLWITSPPKNHNINTTINVVRDVTMVLESDSFILRFTISE